MGVSQQVPCLRATRHPLVWGLSGLCVGVACSALYCHATWRASRIQVVEKPSVAPEQVQQLVYFGRPGALEALEALARTLEARAVTDQDGWFWLGAAYETQAQRASGYYPTYSGADSPLSVEATAGARQRARAREWLDRADIASACAVAGVRRHGDALAFERAYRLRGRVLTRLARYRDAVVYFDRALLALSEESGPGHAESLSDMREAALLGKSIALGLEGAYTDAIAAARQADQVVKGVSEMAHWLIQDLERRQRRQQ